MKQNEDITSFLEEILDYARIQQFTINQDCHTKPATTGETKSVSATLMPTTSQQLEFIIKRANHCQVPLHPLSCGKNWGYSDATPSCDDSVIVDLSRMNKILEINENSKYAIIEPGVTQQQLSDALSKTNLFMDCTGSSTGSSVVGNILERGFGHTPYGDRFGHSCSYEILLGNGHILRTGHLAYEQCDTHNSKTCHSSRTAGPSVEGLFAQSNFGIITKLCIWLIERPPKILPFVAVFKTHEDFLSAIKPISELKMLGVTPSTIHIGNGMRILSSSISWKDVTGLVPHSDIQAQLKQLGIGEWVMSGALYGTKDMIRVYKKELKARLNAHCQVKVSFLDPALIARVSRFVERLPATSFISLKTQLDTAQGLIDMHTGKPTNLFLKGCYHKHRNGYPKAMDSRIDVAKDGCGLIWLSPTAPADKHSISQLLSILHEVFKTHGFHLYTTLSFINARSVALICNPLFNSNDEDEVARATQCSIIALEKCIEHGFPPYRLANVHWPLFQQQLSEQHKLLINAIKNQLDPNGIISPGRYGINTS